jgi:hypothetical protein
MPFVGLRSDAEGRRYASESVRGRGERQFEAECDTVSAALLMA